VEAFKKQKISWHFHLVVVAVVVVVMTMMTRL
jgi:hypothetical protein